MPGGGSKLATTAHNPPARLLDITRLMRRAGRVLTGVDRVELAYARHLTGLEVPCFGLVRSPLGYILVRPDALAGLVERTCGFGKRPLPDLTSRLGRNQTYAQRAAMSDARFVRLARSTPYGLARMLHKHLPAGTVYFNVGHSNLTARVLAAVNNVGEINVLVHDIIPLERPQDQREGSVAPFEAKIRRISAFADRVICNSQETALALSGWYAAKGLHQPETIVAHLGTELAQPRPQDLPEGLPPKGPYFLTVGTIEPRKNHAFLLDIWERLGPDAPTLVIAGSRGWRNEDVFRRLDAKPANVVECTGLSDAALAALMQGARGLLFPSLAEGFGWPPVEAAALGVPVIANDLPIFREVLGNIPIYASVRDVYLWQQEIKKRAATGATRQATTRFEPPSWEAHFNTVLRLT